jgi:hypothetical protein
LPGDSPPHHKKKEPALPLFVVTGRYPCYREEKSGATPRPARAAGKEELQVPLIAGEEQRVPLFPATGPSPPKKNLITTESQPMPNGNLRGVPPFSIEQFLPLKKGLEF